MNPSSDKVRIGLLEDDAIMGESIKQRLTLEGYEVDWWGTASEAIHDLRLRPVRMMISDIRLPDMEGENLFSSLMPIIGHVPVIVITAFGRIEQAVKLIKMGINDYMTKPFSMDVLLERINSFLLVRKDFSPTATLEEVRSCLISKTRSPAMESLVNVLEKVKELDSTLLIKGESGVGKELAAFYVHSQSERADKPFLAVNVASIPADIFESELFGYVKGAFTGANTDRKGYLEAVEDGTLLLDEIGDLPIPVQVNLLRVFEEKKFYQVGGRKEIPFRARVICATNKDLKQMVEEGKFREDLFYRLNVIPIYVPPLRKRTEDIIPLAIYYTSIFSESMQLPQMSISKRGEQALLQHEFAGNVRELKNRIERGVALCRGQILNHYDIFPEKFDAENESVDSEEEELSLQEYMGDLEKGYILHTLEKCDWRIADSAKTLQISRKTLWEKMRRYNIHRLDKYKNSDQKFDI